MVGTVMRSIDVTQPHQPPLEQSIPYLQQIWDKMITYASA
jgi:chemotaxis regulatin CheY-phosphate phosphatase CheZ